MRRQLSLGFLEEILWEIQRFDVRKNRNGYYESGENSLGSFRPVFYLL